MKVIKVKVKDRFDFDQVFLVPFDSRDKIKHLFRYAFVLPFTDEYRDFLVDTVGNAAIKKIDAKTRPKVEGETWVRVEGEQSRLKEQLSDHEHWLMVIPTLPQYKKGSSQAGLKYISRIRSTSSGDVFDELSYLQTPTKAIRPICAMCPKVLDHAEGKCSLGTRECLKYLRVDLEIDTRKEVHDDAVQQRKDLVETLGIQDEQS